MENILSGSKLPRVYFWGVMYIFLALILSISDYYSLVLFIVPLIGGISLIWFEYKYMNSNEFDMNDYAKLGCFVGQGFSIFVLSLMFLLSLRYSGLNETSPIGNWIIYYVNGSIVTLLVGAVLGQLHGETVETQEKLKDVSIELEKQNSRVELFASAISHDLRNPLSIAEGYFSVIKDEIDDDECVKKIDNAFERMEQIITDSLALAQDDVELEKTSTDLEDELNEAWKQVQTGGITLEVEDSCIITADSTYFQQMVENIFRNTVSHADGATRITAGATDEGFFIEDDGNGFPQDLIGRDLNYLDEELGFGLSIVMFLAEKHEWDAHIKVSETGGVRFEFDISDVESNNNSEISINQE